MSTIHPIRSSDVNFTLELGRVLRRVQAHTGYLRVSQSGRELVVIFEPKATTWGGRFGQYIRRLFDSSFNINRGINALLGRIEAFQDSKEGVLVPVMAISQHINASRIFRKIDITQISAMQDTVSSSSSSPADMTDGELVTVMDYLEEGIVAMLPSRLQGFVPLAEEIQKAVKERKPITNYPTIYDNDVAMNIIARRDPIAFVMRNRDNKRAVLFAVRYSPNALGHSSFRGDYPVVLEAVAQFGKARYGASDELQKDRRIISAAFKNNLEVAMGVAQEERAYLLAACPTDTHTLVVLCSQDRIPEGFNRFTGRVEAMKAFLSSSGTKLPDDMYNDDEVMKALAAINSWLLMERYSDDERVALLVARYIPTHILANTDFKNNRAVALEAVKHGCLAFKYCSPGLQADQEVILATCWDSPLMLGVIGYSPITEADSALTQEAYRRNLHKRPRGSATAALPLPGPAASGGGGGGGAAAGLSS